MNHKKIKKLHKAVMRLVRANEAHSWIGSRHPSEFEAIKAELTAANAAYYSRLKEVEHDLRPDHHDEATDVVAAVHTR